MRIFIPESMSSFEEFPFKMHEELRVEKGFLKEIYTLIRSLLKELEYFVKKVVRATPTF
jgi:hypothetical protein